MTSEAQPGQEQRMDLKRCRACGSDCRIEHFEGQHIRGVMTVYVCADNARFGGGCPDEYAYLSEEAWNTRPTADLGEDGDLVSFLRAEALQCQVVSFERRQNALNEAADRLILYREALSWLPAEISALRAAHERMQEINRNDEAGELHIQLEALESVQRQVDAVLSRSGG